MTNGTTPHAAATEPARARGLERVEDENGLVVLRSPLLASLAIPHAFTTRSGSADLDAGALTERDRARILAAGAFDPASEIVHARQVHGREVAAFDGERAPAGPPCADALVTSRERRALLVYTADCVPILIARADGARVAAVHAGWRGLVAGVIARALDALRDEARREHEAAVDGHAGASAAASGDALVAAIGPCLSLARFEVGPEVVDAFHAAELGAAVHARAGARAHVDLRGAARVALERAGVRRVDVSERCTWDDPELWSHRRDVTHGGQPRTGRLGALIACRGASAREARRDARSLEREP